MNPSKIHTWMRANGAGRSIHWDLRITMNAMYDRYQKPLFIVENGLGAVDVPDENGYVADDYRIAYMAAHIEAMKDAVNLDGVESVGLHQLGLYRPCQRRNRRNEETLRFHLRRPRQRRQRAR